MPATPRFTRFASSGALLGLTAVLLLLHPGIPELRAQAATDASAESAESASRTPLPSPAPHGEYERFEFAEMHMAIRVRIVLYAADHPTALDAASAAFARIAELEDILSDYRTASELRRLERRPGEWVPVSEELFTVLEAAVEMARLTDGAFDPTVGPLSGLWREARRTGRLPTPAAVDSARALTGWEELALDPERRAIRVGVPGMRFDLGGIAKGYILDEALEAVRGQGVDRVLLEAGGDIRVGAPPPTVDEEAGPGGWRIRVGLASSIEGEVAGELGGELGDELGQGLDETGAERQTRELPTSLAQRAGALRDAALATSGGSAQFLEVEGVRYSHIVDPRTGLGLTHDLTAIVIAPRGMLADALATALSVLDPEEGRRLLERFPEVQVALHSPGR